MSDERIAGGRYAFQVAHPAAPMLRIRYRPGVPVDPWGFPEWTPYARVIVALPAADPARTVEQSRVADVWAATAAIGADATPPGWTWAFRAQAREVALVPVELHAAFRHLGGVSTGARDRAGHGLPVAGGPAPRAVVTERLSAAALDKTDGLFGGRLPDAYRDFLGRTNGAGPSVPAVHPGCGFVLDQPLLGFRDDRTQDLQYANAWLTDRLTPDWLAIGFVQGGLLTLKIRGADTGAVGWLDDDDPRDRDHFTAEDVCERLLHRVAPDFSAFWAALRPVPPELRGRTGERLHPERLGALLPASHRAPS